MSASKEKQIDVVLVIDDQHLNEWHADNMTHNPQHYASYWRYTATKAQGRDTQPSRAMQRVQQWGPGIWYATLDHVLNHVVGHRSSH